jgi:hypothetical protein
MTDTHEIIIAAIVAIPPTIASAAALIVSMRHGQKIDAIHMATNSMKDALVASTRLQALAEGLAAGIEVGKLQVAKPIQDEQGPT